jgi:DNA-binding FrmR family transcriptional regulator
MQPCTRCSAVTAQLRAAASRCEVLRHTVRGLMGAGGAGHTARTLAHALGGVRRFGRRLQTCTRCSAVMVQLRAAASRCQVLRHTVIGVLGAW